MSDTNSEQNVKNIYFTESRELLDSMELSLLSLEKESTDEESINALFRAAHTIKGNSGMFGFLRIGEFTHVLENVLVSVRNGTIGITTDIINLFLECHDFIRTLLYHYESESETPLGDQIEVEFKKLVTRLNFFLPVSEPRKNIECGANYGIFEDDVSSALDQLHVGNDCWHISLRFEKNVFKDGLDPFSFISSLGEKGEITGIRTVYDEMPCGDEMIADLCYLGFEMDFRSSASKQDIEDIFTFVKNDCKISILPPYTFIDDYVKLIEELPENPMRIGEMLLEIGSLTEAELEKALELQADLSLEKNKTPGGILVGNILVEEKMVQKYILEAALSKQEKVKKREESDRKLIRVDSENLIIL